MLFAMSFGLFAIFSALLLTPTLAALISMRQRRLDPLLQLVWVGFVLLCPLVGPLAYFVLRPGELAAAEG